MGKGSRRREGRNYEEGFDAIFGKGVKAKSGRYIIDKETGRTIEVIDGPRTGGGIVIHGDIEPFVSPITREVISSRSALRQHNKAHGVTDSRDYSKDFMEKKTIERSQRILGLTKEDKQHRIESLIHAVDLDRSKRR